MDRDLFGGAPISMDPTPPPAPPAASEYATPETPAYQPAQPSAPAATPAQAQPTPEQPVAQPRRDPAGRWMSADQWTREMLRGEEPATPQPQQAQPEATAPQPAVETPAPQSDEAARQFEAQRVAFEQERAQFEQQRQRQQTEQQIAQFRANWDNGRAQLLERVKAMPADQAIAAINRYGTAERDAYLQFQGQALSQREAAARTQLQTIEQERYAEQVRSMFPGFAREVAASSGLGQLTQAELDECVAIAEQFGNGGAIQTHIQTSILPRRQMQQELEQVRRSRQVDANASAGVYAVSGGTGNPAGGSRIPKGGLTADQAAAAWYG